MNKMILLILLLLITMTCEASDEIKVATDLWEPWVYGEIGSKPTDGIAIKILDHIAKKADFKYKAIIYPFARALNNVQSGENDMILLVVDSPKRHDQMIFTAPVVTEEFYLYYKNKRVEFKNIKNMKDLNKYTIGTVRGFIYGNEWNNLSRRYNFKLSPVNNDLQNLRRLNQGRVDAIIMGKANAKILLRRNAKESIDIARLDKPINITQLSFGISKKSKLISKIDLINKEIENMIKDGSMKKIIETSY